MVLFKDIYLEEWQKLQSKRQGGVIARETLQNQTIPQRAKRNPKSTISPKFSNLENQTKQENTVKHKYS